MYIRNRGWSLQQQGLGYYLKMKMFIVELIFFCSRDCCHLDLILAIHDFEKKQNNLSCLLLVFNIQFFY